MGERMEAAAGGHGQRHSIQVSAHGGLGRIEVSVRVEPDHSDAAFGGSENPLTALTTPGQYDGQRPLVQCRLDRGLERAIERKAGADLVAKWVLEAQPNGADFVTPRAESI